MCSLFHRSRVLHFVTLPADGWLGHEILDVEMGFWGAVMTAEGRVRFVCLRASSTSGAWPSCMVEYDSDGTIESIHHEGFCSYAAPF
jgi:hypothetical protein